jgi:glycosyltransferase involved in cell wall biosynthesis
MVQHPTNCGLSAARNTGIRESSGKWIALLDDDDEWYPDKLEKQVAAGEIAGGSRVFVISRYLEATSHFINIRPEVLPLPSDTGKRFTEYLYCRRGLIVPVVFLISRTLALEYPFDPSLQPAEDNDFSIRCMANPLTKLVAVDEVLAIYNNLPVTASKRTDGDYRLSKNGDWKHVLAWALRQRDMFSGAAFASLLTRSIAQIASEQGARWREKMVLLQVALWMGEFSPVHLLQFFISSFFTRETKHWVRWRLSTKARQYSKPVDRFPPAPRR